MFLVACAGGGTGQTSSGTVLVLDTGNNIGTGDDARDNAAVSPGPLYEDVGEETQRYLGTRTAGTIANPAHYETAEFYNSGYWVAPLAATNFSDAYARGWTGHGSLITIADTGVDPDHPDLAPNIGFSRDFSGTGIEDNNGHGTHVAGIAAAVRDGNGTHGAAFDATLAIGKVTDTRSYSFETAAAVAQWGRDLGSVAVNVSAAYGRNSFLESRLVQIGEEDYYLDYAGYGTNGFYDARSAAYGWKTALGPEQILVKAAGNDGTSYSAGFNQLATASDASGALILDGQVLIVGNWDAANQRIIGNRAGNVCVTWINDRCHDAARISDLFIMAPGTDIYAPYRYGSYAYLTGTSMAAPMVAGAIGVLHQMWPHMKGRDLAQLLLQTAQKDIPGYRPHIHGQGLLDMDQATQPVGATGLPLSGRTGGGVTAVTGGISGVGIGSDSAAAFARVMVLDAFERDFYFDLGAGVVARDTRQGSLAEAGRLYDSYAPYFDTDQHLAHTLPMARDVTLTMGGGASSGHYFGTSLSGVFGDLRDSYTAYALADYRRPVGPLHISGQIGKGVTLLDVETEGSLLQSAAPVHTSTMAVTAEHNGDNAVIGLSVQRPVTVDQARMRYRLPVARTRSGAVIHDERTINLKPDQPALDYGLFLRSRDQYSRMRWALFAELRTNVAGTRSTNRRVGAKLAFKL